MHSGIATISREIVLGTCHKYDWAQLAGSVKHPDKGKVFDLSDAAKQERGVDDAYVKLYPTDGYGNPDVLNQLIQLEKPDAILHFTDPRFWMWLYQMERDIRKNIPLTYLNIWDDCPAPMWNRPFYKSCDLLMGISKQTVNLNKIVLGKNDFVCADDVKSPADCKGKSIIHYVPHGIDENMFKPLDKNDPLVLEMKKKILKNKDYKYILFSNNRNIQRKRTSNIILAYRTFCDSLPKKDAEKCCLLLHTQPVDDNGTDLPTVVKALCPDYDVVFSAGKVEPKQMNALYNLADVTINVASNEGFGLSHAESLMTGTPIINNVTGGLQDGCGFTDDNGNSVEFSAQWGSNHDGRYKKHGKWVKPVYPVTRLLQGSPPTPYIFDDHAKWEDVADAMMFWYLAGDEKRKECGEAGRQFVLGEGGLNSTNMCNQLIFAMETTMDNFTPRNKFSLHTTDEHVGHEMKNGMGFEIPKIDVEKIKQEVEQL